MSAPTSPSHPFHLSPHHTTTTTTNLRRILRWKGVRPLPLFICVTLGLILRFAVPKPRAVAHNAWSLLAIFIATVAGLILSPLPVGAWAFVCLTLTVVTKTLTFAAAFSAFTNEVIWLIVVSFFFSRGFVKTGLGDRIAMFFVRWLGKSTLGLSYGLVLGSLPFLQECRALRRELVGFSCPLLSLWPRVLKVDLRIHRLGNLELI
ncbi:UNVERIFIED_CONTAM: Dicarboxylate transporter 2, chloroplastic [Sesamum calycinum]|uniref:Dicarboxylate transporter 2, chloroplastic n=1 Tax=Sesamum calycinum TaxID=2727403 RepID=A0AAW2QJ53_9LAMI